MDGKSHRADGRQHIIVGRDDAEVRHDIARKC